MKKQILFFVAVMVAGITVASAQGPGGGRMSIEDRVARVHAKLDSAFKLDAAKLTQSDSIFANYYRAQQAKMQELMGGGERPSREAMQEATKPLTDARDEKLKTVMTEAQLKIFKEEIEPSLRGGGRPGGGRPGQR